MDNELERLLIARETARDEFETHLKTAVVAWYGDRPPSVTLEPITLDWLQRHDELRVALREAEEALNGFLHSHVER